jgi:hypothetical protein
VSDCWATRAFVLNNELVLKGQPLRKLSDAMKHRLVALGCARFTVPAGGLEVGRAIRAQTETATRH